MKTVDKEKVKFEAKKRMLKHRYGLDYQTYQNMYDRQGGCCAICKEPKQLGGPKGLHVDYCQGSKQVRGLLCISCNTALGKFKENIEFLEAAINYLKLSENK